MYATQKRKSTYKGLIIFGLESTDCGSNVHLFVCFRVFDLGFQRLLAAFLAILIRSRFESFLARDRPPFIPPLRPISAKYADTADRSGSGSLLASPTRSLATWWAR